MKKLLPIDLNETTAITADLVELNGQIQLLQIELSKPMRRIKKVMAKTDEYGDEITDEEKDKIFAKAKTEYEKCKEACSKSIRELPKKKLEPRG